MDKTAGKSATKELLPTHRDIKAGKLRILKAEAKSLKQNLTAFTTESAKADARDGVETDENLYQLCTTSGLKMDRDVFQHLLELIRLDVNPDKIVDILEVLTKFKEDGEISLV